MEANYFILDVFTNVPFGGNQLAVFTDAAAIPEEKLQVIANEMNLSETVFLYPPETAGGDFKMRIFTPANEMPTAGHPTIGTAHLLLNELHRPLKKEEVLIIEQPVGPISVTFQQDAGYFNLLTMQQPNPIFGNLIQNRSMIADMLSIKEDELMPGMPIQCISCGNNFMYIPVTSLAVLAKIKIRVDLLQQHANKLGTQALYIFTTNTESESDTRGRMFAPLWGMHEDPATGSASGPLGCYLVRHAINDGKMITCEQGVEMGRPSTIKVQIGHENEVVNKVLVGGEAVLVGKGTMFV